MIAIVDYGLGNVQAFANIYKRLGISCSIVSSSSELSAARKVILPGVGSFDWAMKLLNDSGMRECLDDLVLVQHVPVLGVCVGMQILAQRSEEGQSRGLGWIDAEVVKFAIKDISSKAALPHMGWNTVKPNKADYLFQDLDDRMRFYFLHSYHFVSKYEDEVLATTDYHGQFTSGVRANNIFGVQFHPEKSHHWGIQLLKNFSEI